MVTRISSRRKPKAQLHDCASRRGRWCAVMPGRAVQIDVSAFGPQLPGLRVDLRPVDACLDQVLFGGIDDEGQQVGPSNCPTPGCAKQLPDSRCFAASSAPQRNHGDVAQSCS